MGNVGLSRYDMNEIEPDVAWWGKRRVFYNLFALGFAAVGFLLFFGVMTLPGMLPKGEDSVEPMGLLCGALLIPALLNGVYSAGLLMERFMAKRYPGRPWRSIVFRAGL